MRVRKAVITAAAPGQRHLPLQTLVDRDGAVRSVLAILVAEVLEAKIEEIGVVIHPDDETVYRSAAGDHAARLTFLPQAQPQGYAHAVYQAREFVGGEPFLQLVGDHLYVSRGGQSAARRLALAAENEHCSVSAVKATRENLLGRFGAVGGQLIRGRDDLYRVETVIEKPTPTEAEQKLVVSGLRMGHYLCFFGMHVFTAPVMELLEEAMSAGDPSAVSLASVLDRHARREKHLALAESASRYDLGAKYGLWTAQLALALAGGDREQALSQLVTLLAETGQGAAAS